jgi:hypothetical protein
MIKLIKEEQVLELGFRKKVIEQIKSDANQSRKREMKKRSDVYSDLTVKWVIQKLKDEGLKDKTLKLMQNRAANISICRKIINKLARCYSGSVIRDTGSPAGNEILDRVHDLLNHNQNQVKIDRYKRLYRNVFSATLPEVEENYDGKPIYRLSQRVFAPWQYDVIEEAKNPTGAGCVIFSDYDETSLTKLPVGGSTQLSARKDAESYAEQESSDDYQTYIWWTDTYHFTTDSKGSIIQALSPEGMLNPIGEIPGVTYADNQESGYWSSGGDDLVDGSILINTLITDMNAIAFIQGWGQYVVTGKKLPAVLEGGPHSALVFTYEEGEPEPKVQVVNANPPLESWMKLIEQYTALLLSTNDLSPGSVSMKLDPSAYPSGIAMLIEKSEAHNAIDQSRKEFIKGEREQFEITRKWQNYLLSQGQLDDEWLAIGPIPEDLDFTVKFENATEVVSEKEKLEVIKLRKELGLNTEVELLQIDNPDLSEEDAAEKLAKIKAEKLGKAAVDMAQIVDQSFESTDSMDSENGNESA